MPAVPQRFCTAVTALVAFGRPLNSVVRRQGKFMASGWVSTRDGHSYSSLLLDADASSAPLNTIEIGSIRVRGGSITSAQLHALLWDTQQWFRGSSLVLDLNRDVRAALDACTQQGSVTWELIQNPLSQQARILAVVARTGSN
jgi:hypothetical protein